MKKGYSDRGIRMGVQYRGMYPPLEINEDMVYPRQKTPEENLMLAVLYISIMDLFNPKASKSERDNSNYYLFINNKIDYYCANHKQKHPNIFSFPFICAYFGWDIEKQRQKINNLTWEKIQDNIRIARNIIKEDD